MSRCSKPKNAMSGSRRNSISRILSQFRMGHVFLILHPMLLIQRRQDLPDGSEVIGGVSGGGKSGRCT
jgi:hypothetical protein